MFTKKYCWILPACIFIFSCITNLFIWSYYIDLLVGALIGYYIALNIVMGEFNHDRNEKELHRAVKQLIEKGKID